jgi:hypothetical protein
MYFLLYTVFGFHAMTHHTSQNLIYFFVVPTAPIPQNYEFFSLSCFFFQSFFPPSYRKSWYLGSESTDYTVCNSWTKTLILKIVYTTSVSMRGISIILILHVRDPLWVWTSHKKRCSAHKSFTILAGITNQHVLLCLLTVASLCLELI